MIEFLKGILQLMRPAEWSKSLSNMALAVVFAGFMHAVEFDLMVFLYGAVAVCLLWSGLYALNDYTDRNDDAKHDLKRHRAIPSGKVSAGFALVFSLALVLISFAIAFSVSSLLLLCMLVMLFNHLLYTMKPFNFKKRPVVDLVSGSLVNPVFRFYSGWVLFVPAFNAPLLALIFIAGLQFGGYGLYRMMSEKFDKKQGYKSSVVVFGENLKFVFIASLAIGMLAFFLACFSKPLGFHEIGFLPMRYLWLVILSIPAVPFYLKAIKKPEAVNSKKEYHFFYRLIYAHTILFFAGFVLLYLF